MVPPPSTAGPATEPLVNLRAHLQDTVCYVVVDEYIARLIQLGANLCVVGDDDQTIYQWCGAQ
ncbi:UvrD-helicase domain-containing protein [Streptomyces capoamus]|uniref:UvrD-helicase domain-containing protein n=1 Tax=Streptomyces capoamus TaxID=68183 RepID=UPI003C2CABBD